MTEPADPDIGDGGLVRLRLDLGYDGSGFAGWASQPGERTVQTEVEVALRTVLRRPRLRVVCAGRTDAGVHARQQVAHADVPADCFDGDTRALGRRLVGVLPRDIGLRSVAVAPEGFDARFSPLWRRYAYRLSEHPFGVEALRRHDVLDHRRKVDVAAMCAAAEGLLGKHDFAAFCRRREGATTLRTLQELTFSRVADGDVAGSRLADRGLVVGHIVADAFCHNMVRALVGALLAVGDGRRPVPWPAEVMAGGVRLPDVTVVAAQGLTLEEVRYPPPDDMARRAAATRARRRPT